MRGTGMPFPGATPRGWHLPSVLCVSLDFVRYFQAHTKILVKSLTYVTLLQHHVGQLHLTFDKQQSTLDRGST